MIKSKLIFMDKKKFRTHAQIFYFIFWWGGGFVLFVWKYLGL